MSAQLKEAEEIVAGSSSEIGVGIDSETVSIGGSVCVDIVAEEVEGMITWFV